MKQGTVIDITLLQQRVRVEIGLSFVMISFFICSMLTVIFVSDPKSAANVIYSIVGAVYDSSGSVEEGLETEFQFSTPTPKTAAFMQAEAMKADAKCDLKDINWYTTDDTRIQAFTQALKDAGVQGYNRWEALGAGTNCEKPVYIWQVNTTKSSRLDRRKLLSLYEAYFGRDHHIYIRETKLGQTLSSVAK